MTCLIGLRTRWNSLPISRVAGSRATGKVCSGTALYVSCQLLPREGIREEHEAAGPVRPTGSDAERLANGHAAAAVRGGLSPPELPDTADSREGFHEPPQHAVRHRDVERPRRVGSERHCLT